MLCGKGQIPRWAAISASALLRRGLRHGVPRKAAPWQLHTHGFCNDPRASYRLMIRKSLQPSFPVLHFQSPGCIAGNKCPLLRGGCWISPFHALATFCCFHSKCMETRNLLSPCICRGNGSNIRYSILSFLYILYMILPFYSIPISTFWQRNLAFFVQFP